MPTNRFLAKMETVWCDLSAILTHGFSAKRKIVWHDLSAILTRRFSAKKEGMWHDLLCAKITFKKTHNNGFIIVSMASVTTRYKPIQIIALTVSEF